ncbi:hypothetical protein [Streptomyces asoensis]|uniref:Uncharacterized protein n=1 Tax=Streptomyces asoensis TaxID=249586 RepID=A0ABQ3S4X5_9ACTN|nr:hypothetical protein [Streptomyces asoensis]GGQ65838.1 hypothetical protein GCM10010496_31500 [Streptomyces asoensis]GHI63169.1 hypothetical protein Saso_48190 [Streptomyces asoensis]
MLDVTDPESWIDLDLRVRELASQRPELFHSRASRSGRRMYWHTDASLPTVTWDREPDDAELALALCHPDGRIREAALDRARGRPVLLALVVVRCADWVEPVRARARAMLAEAPRHQLVAHAPLVLRVGHRFRGALAERLLIGALRTGTAAQLEGLLDSGDRATARLAHRVAVERRLLPAARLALIAARHHDAVVQDVCADGASAALGDGEPGRFTEVVPPLLGSRRPRVRSAGVTALRRAGRYGDAEPYLTDRSAVVRACARYVVRQGGTDPAPLYRALCADPAARPAAVGLSVSAGCATTRTYSVRCSRTPLPACGLAPWRDCAHWTPSASTMYVRSWPTRRRPWSGRSPRPCCPRPIRCPWVCCASSWPRTVHTTSGSPRPGC